jgi:SAM-dependent methyltransferase
LRPDELRALAAVERDHWFYRGKRKIVQAWMQHLGLPDGSGRPIVDVGAGTGILLSELERGGRTIGVEYAPTGLSLARETTRSPLVRGSAEAIPLADGTAQLVVALDVIEHLDDDARAVAEMARVLAPGGHLMINVPACMALWSDWDEALGHRRRYSLDMLGQVLSRPELEVRHLAYTNWLAFLPIWLIRRWRTHVRPSRRRAEDQVPLAAVNDVLEAAYVLPATWSWFRPPLGVSVFGVARRRPELGANAG